jgi:tyrosinase
MANGMILRKDVTKLDPDELLALRDAYGKMMEFSAGDNRSWIYWAGYHGFPNWYCWHHGRVGQGSQQPFDLFLPWHRAYLLYWEHAARDQNANAALPWWDWASDESHVSGVPEAFSVATVDGAPNSLLSGPVPRIQDQPARQTLRFPGSPDDLPTRAAVSALLDLTNFVDFSDQLEDVHDQIHGWTGGASSGRPARFGDMGSVVSSAYDPIFWSHHCMIDRMWYLWQLRQGINNIPRDYLERPLEPFALRVADVLDIRALGYDYAVTSVDVEV